MSTDYGKFTQQIRDDLDQLDDLTKEENWQEAAKAAQQLATKCNALHGMIVNHSKLTRFEPRPVERARRASA